MTTLTTVADAEGACQRAAAEIARTLEEVRAQRGVAHLALTGGGAPKRAYELLARELPSFADVQVWFGDERCVPPDDAESNYLLAATALLDPAGIPADQIHRMEGELGPTEGAERYARALREHAPSDGPDAMPVLDLIVLGIGPDGHVASLFPGAPTLDADERELCLGVTDSPKPPPQRITLSLGVLLAARRCMVLATGAGKADAISAMLAEPSRHVPASLLARDRLTVIVDDAASPPAARALTRGAHGAPTARRLQCARRRELLQWPQAQWPPRPRPPKPPARRPAPSRPSRTSIEARQRTLALIAPLSDARPVARALADHEPARMGPRPHRGLRGPVAGPPLRRAGAAATRPRRRLRRV